MLEKYLDLHKTIFNGGLGQDPIIKYLEKEK